MKRYVGALVTTVALSGTLCLVGTGTAQATSGQFNCGAVMYNATGKTLFGGTCFGGPVTATTGWVTSSETHVTYRCTTLRVDPFTDLWSFVYGNACNPT